MSDRGLAADKLVAAWQHYHECYLCEHRCRANRLQGQRGPCHAGTTARVFKQRVEFGEEQELVPSHLFYLSGCDLRCAFCIAEANAFDPSRGRELGAEWFREAVKQGRKEGARTLQWVGGEPNIHLPALMAVMAECPELPPVVWKSDFHGTPEAFALLAGVVDVYLADFKFGNNACARRLAGIDNYFEIVTRNLLIASRQGDLIVRHLLLPGHFECCYVPLVEWLRENLPEAKFSLRDCYLPRWRARRIAEIARPLHKHESGPAFELADRFGLKMVS